MFCFIVFIDEVDLMEVEVVNEDLVECCGLVFIDGLLFVMVNNDKVLFCLCDNDGDDWFEEVECVVFFVGDVGYGCN